MKLTCIMCPKGCEITIQKNKDTLKVSGNSCPRGEVYAKQEILNPSRILTSIIKTKNGVISVKTTKPIPKNLIKQGLLEIKNLKIDNAKFGYILIANFVNSGASLVVTREAIKN